MRLPWCSCCFTLDKSASVTYINNNLHFLYVCDIYCMFYTKGKPKLKNASQKSYRAPCLTPAVLHYTFGSKGVLQLDIKASNEIIRWSTAVVLFSFSWPGNHIYQKLNASAAALLCLKACSLFCFCPWKYSLLKSSTALHKRFLFS